MIFSHVFICDLKILAASLAFSDVDDDDSPYVLVIDEGPCSDDDDVCLNRSCCDNGQRQEI